MPHITETPKDAFFAGRLSKPMSDLVRETNESPRQEWERRNLVHVLRVDFAHVVMLSEQGLLTKYQAGLLVRELTALSLAGPESFTMKPGYGSIVLQVEAKLAAKLGEDVAGRLSIARSRLDQGATVWRLSYRTRIQQVLKELVNLQETLVTVAANHHGTPMVSYTHLQQAQPANFGHYLLAFRDRLQDSFQIFTQVFERINRCPLGAVGLSGTDLAIDRQLSASLLGFPRVLENSRLGRDAYYHIEITSALALMMTYLNDLCADLHIYSSTEFGVIELDDSHTSTSSIFPHKKNPYALETIKARAADSQGWSAAALASFRTEGSGDTAIRSFSELEMACVTSTKMLQLAAEVVTLMVINGDRCHALLESSWTTTNRLSNVLLTRYGVSNRTAHGIVARLVKHCLGKGISKSAVTVDMFQDAAREMGAGRIAITQDVLIEALDHRSYILNSVSLGSVGPEQVGHLVTVARKQNSVNQGWVAEHELHAAQADERLRQACEALHITTLQG